VPLQGCVTVRRRRRRCARRQGYLRTKVLSDGWRRSTHRFGVDGRPARRRVRRRHDTCMGMGMRHEQMRGGTRRGIRDHRSHSPGGPAERHECSESRTGRLRRRFARPRHWHARGRGVADVLASLAPRGPPWCPTARASRTTTNTQRLKSKHHGISRPLTLVAACCDHAACLRRVSCKREHVAKRLCDHGDLVGMPPAAAQRCHTCFVSCNKPNLAHLQWTRFALKKIKNKTLDGPALLTTTCKCTRWAPKHLRCPCPPAPAAATQ